MASTALEKLTIAPDAKNPDGTLEKRYLHGGGGGILPASQL